MNKGDQKNIAAIMIMALLAFGLQIPWLGFFQDDWNFVFYSSSHGTQGLLEFLSTDGRPGATWVYVLGFTLLGYEPARWQLFTLLLRILTTLGFGKILNILWPRHAYGNLVAAIIFLAHPFFTLQPLSVAYAPHFMAYFLYMISVLLMIRTVEMPENYLRYTIPAVVCTFAQLFTVEYFIGLELLRPIIIAYVLSRQAQAPMRWRTTIQKVLTLWLPYALILVFFVVWRTFVLSRLASQNDPLSTVLSLQMISTITQNVVADWILMFVSAWFTLIDPKLFVLGSISNTFLIAVGIAGASLYYFLLRSSSGSELEKNDLRGILVAGTLLFVTGMIAAYSTGYIVHSKVAPWNSRFALPALGGLALLTTGLTQIIITSPKTRHVFLAVVFGLLIARHNQITLNFKAAWEKQERLYEQLIWRAPDIRPGTAIVANEEIVGYMGEYPTSFAINTMYESRETDEIPIWFLAFSGNYISAENQADHDGELETHKATVTFRGKKEDALYIIYEPENQQCLWVLRKEDSDYKYIPDRMRSSLLSSSLAQIQATPKEYNLYHTIVKENKNTWCYFYQKADLARQLGKPKEVANLWEQSQMMGFQPANGFEYIPFIEAYAQLGQWEDAFYLSKKANSVTKAMYFVLCPTWTRLELQGPDSPEKDDFINKAYDLLRCVPD